MEWRHGRSQGTRIAGGSWSSKPSLFTLLLSPVQQSCDELKNLKLLGVRSVQCQEVKEMVRDNLAVDDVSSASSTNQVESIPINIVFRLALLEES